MMRTDCAPRLLGWLLLAVMAMAPSLYAQPVVPPEPERELRGVWVASVSNLDWPLSRTRTTAQNQADLRAIFDRAAAMNLNAIVLQIRPQCDALYPSPYEPWSQYLTNSMGTPPNPLWDPLEFAITEAHARGLELHAWFNPYRALVTATQTNVHSSHITKTRPDLVRTYGTYKWLDPGHPEVQQYSIDVILDVVRRYDIDGVHIDDYFYPYPVSGESFPDETTYQTYGGGMTLADWRRNNVDTFVERLYTEIKAEKKSVRFGISPFGIWRPGNPPGIQGLDSYASIYADSRKWLNNGWCDYFTPQIYWAIDPPAQSFTALMDWWITQNPHNRHIWPGTAVYKLGGSWDWPASEIVNQITETRLRSGATGNIHFREGNFAANTKSIRTVLQGGVYSQRVLAPASPWLSDGAPAPPVVTRPTSPATTWQWSVAPGQPQTFRWAVAWRTNGVWSTAVQNRAQTSRSISWTGLTHVAVASVDTLGMRSEWTIVDLSNGSNWFIQGN